MSYVDLKQLSSNNFFPSICIMNGCQINHTIWRGKKTVSICMRFCLFRSLLMIICIVCFTSYNYYEIITLVVKWYNCNFFGDTVHVFEYLKVEYIFILLWKKKTCFFQLKFHVELFLLFSIYTDEALEFLLLLTLLLCNLTL